MSTVCKFFQTNSCRFGNRCRYRHAYEESQYIDSRSKPSGVSILKSNNVMSKTNYYPQLNQETDIKKLTDEVAHSIKAIEEQGLWPLSCIGCIPSCGNLEGFDDLSPEELRWKAYERGNGTFESYVEETQMLLRKAAAVRSVFICKGPTAQSILNTYVANGLKKESNMTNTSTNVFGSSPFSAPQQTAQTFGFGQPDFRAQQQPGTFNTKIFAQALSEGGNEMKNNIFGQPIQPAQRNFFGQPIEMQADSITSNFGQVNSGNDIFKQNIFANALQGNQPSAASNFFLAQPSSTVSFAQPNIHAPMNAKQVSVNVLYSHIEDLNTEELEQYKSTTFTYGKTPLKPPPKELC